MKQLGEKKIIGRSEKVSLPEFNLNDIDSKVDTGAYRGAIHVSEAEEVEKDGQKSLRLIFLDEAHPEYNNKEFFVKNYKKTTVKNSIGGKEERYIIATTIKIGGKKIKIDLGVSDRKDMRYPLLVGRRTLKGRFIVDPSKEFIY